MDPCPATPTQLHRLAHALRAVHVSSAPAAADLADAIARDPARQPCDEGLVVMTTAVLEEVRRRLDAVGSGTAPFAEPHHRGTR